MCYAHAFSIRALGLPAAHSLEKIPNLNDADRIARFATAINTQVNTQLSKTTKPPKLSEFSRHAAFMTLQCGATPQPGLPVVKRGTSNDVSFARDTIEQFCTAALEKLYRRGWAHREDIWLRWDGFPEDRTASGALTPLHYHFLIDGTRFDRTPLQDIGAVLVPVWCKIAHRRWGHVPKLDLRRARNVTRVSKYNRKNLGRSAALNGHEVFKFSRKSAACLIGSHAATPAMAV